MPVDVQVEVKNRLINVVSDTRNMPGTEVTRLIISSVVVTPEAYVGPRGISGYSGYSGYTGPKGDKGDRGDSGFSGISGFSGYSGYSCVSGYSGYSGLSGYSGSKGSSGWSGESGYSGTSGYSGFSGIGESGYSGYSGYAGYSGFSGMSGFSGYSGYSCVSGYSGFSGFSGAVGKEGLSGARGLSGYSGYSGAAGYAGSSGYSGYSGQQGQSGFSGFSGYSGYGFSGNIYAKDVIYENPSNPEIDNVEEALNLLMYTDLSITLSNDKDVVEIGSTVTQVTLNWEYNKLVESQSLNMGIGQLNPSVRSYTQTGLSLRGDTTYTLTANDGRKTKQCSTVVKFRNKRYWGVSSLSSVTDSDILNFFLNEFSTNRFQTRIFDTSDQGNYIYLVYPVSWGIPQIYVNGVLNTSWVTIQRPFTNLSGHTEEYYIFRSLNVRHGNGIRIDVL